MASWTLVSTMHGIPETVLPCVAHHLRRTDAGRFHVYLDAPHPVIEAALRSLPRVRLTVCDAAYWARHPGGRPETVVARQRANMRDARVQARSDWLVHLDADEFLVPAAGDGPLTLGPALAAVPAGTDWARIANLERIFVAGAPRRHIFEGVFRAPSADAGLMRQVYGPHQRYLHNGFSGHIRGKIAIRRDSPLEARLHDAIWPAGSGRPRPQTGGPTSAAETPPFVTLADARLLHFEGWTALHWQSKLLRMIEAGRLTGHNPGRMAAIARLAETRDPHDRLRLFRGGQVLGPRALALLAENGLLSRRDFDIRALTRRVFPGVDFDFTTRAFDARLRAADPAFYARHGFAPAEAEAAPGSGSGSGAG